MGCVCESEDPYTSLQGHNQWHTPMTEWFKQIKKQEQVGAIKKIVSFMINIS